MPRTVLLIISVITVVEVIKQHWLVIKSITYAKRVHCGEVIIHCHFIGGSTVYKFIITTFIVADCSCLLSQALPT